MRGTAFHSYRPLQIGVWAFACLVLSAGSCNEEDVDRMVSVRFDPSVSVPLQNTIKRDIRSMANFGFNIPERHPFLQVFGAEGSRSVVRYLDERINYVIGPEPSVNQFLTHERSSPLSGLIMGRHQAPANFGGNSAGPSLKAQNIGLDLWLNQEASAGDLMFSLGGSAIPISSPRIGLFRIYPDYLTDFFIENISILIHEARHSDCTGGLTDELLDAVRDGDFSVPSQCGHRHSICQRGDYRGLPACDAFAWGAYSIQALWLEQIATPGRCGNCRRRDQILAQALYIDAKSRVPDYPMMIRGDFGPPDMTSAGTSLDRIRGALQDFRTRRQREVAPQ